MSISPVQPRRSPQKHRPIANYLEPQRTCFLQRTLLNRRSPDCVTDPGHLTTASRDRAASRRPGRSRTSLPGDLLAASVQVLAEVSAAKLARFCIQCRPLGGRGYGDNRKCMRTATMWLAHAVARECNLRGQHSMLNYRWRHSNVSRVVLP